MDERPQPPGQERRGRGGRALRHREHLGAPPREPPPEVVGGRLRAPLLEDPAAGHLHPQERRRQH
eukprot:5050943-Alexandrium_andersonii.AAC.1